MDEHVVNPRAIREVEFRERMRGYHQDDVDAFLERVAEGVEVLERELADARRRIRELEARLALADEQRSQESAAGVEVDLDPDSVIGRTLRLAQETAQTLRRDAEAEAEALRREAATQAARVVDEAKARAAALEEEFRSRFEREAAEVRARSDRLAASLAGVIERLQAEGRIEGSLRELARHARSVVDDLVADGSLLAKDAAGLAAEAAEAAGGARSGGSAGEPDVDSPEDGPKDTGAEVAPDEAGAATADRPTGHEAGAGAEQTTRDDGLSMLEDLFGEGASSKPAATESPRSATTVELPEFGRED